MAEKKAIDLYISDAREFAQPILEHLRSLVHKASPDIVETIKWGMPHFEYAGKILCSMAAFKEHCAFGFRQATLMKDPHDLLNTGDGKSGMGHFGQIKTLKDLPSDKILLQYLREGISLIDQGAKLPTARSTASRDLIIPKEFTAVLKRDKVAYGVFEKLSYSHKKEYVEWITGAKTEATKNKRMNTALEWLTEGKSMNWKYEKKR